MGRWTLAANEKRTQHLTHTGWNFTSVLELPLSGYLGGTDIGVSLYKKKTNWPWGARWNSLPVALCNQGVLCSTQHSALQQSPALGALQHTCFDSIFAQFCSFAATCAFKVLCSTSSCFAALNALKHFAHSSFAACAYGWRSCSWSSLLGAWFLNRSWQGEWE